jgi:hypothetical protein
LITTGTQTIAGTKTFNDATKNNGGIFLQNASSNSLAGYMNLGGLTNGVKFTSGGGVSNNFTLPSATGYTFTFPNATGTIALTSDISYPVTSVFGRTGAVVATSGDYTTAQVTESGNLYFTDSRARLALSFVAGSGAYNSTTGVITIPTNNNQITNGSNYITLGSLSAGVGISYNNTTGVITNSAPDQTVSITAGAGISVSGTYPSFTIASTITQYTDALARLAISLTTTGTSGAATYNNTTGVLNIPQYADQFVGTVTSVAALTIGTSGTDVSSTVANSTTTPVITLNIPSASATARGLVTIGSQTFAGVKTFNSDIVVNGLKIGTGVMNIATNTAVGVSALNAGTGAGDYNVAVGYNAMLVNIDGNESVAVGTYSLRNNLNGALNTAVGMFALSGNTNGYYNTAVGHSALTANTIGEGNTAVGISSLGAVTTGTYNIGIGQGAGVYITTGSKNTIVGKYAGTTTMANNVVLADGDGNIRFHWDGTNIKLNGNNAITQSGTITTNYLPKFTGASTIGNSIVYDNGNGIAFNGTNISYAATNRGNITINGTSGIIGFNNSGTAMGYFFHDGTNMQMWNELSGSLIFGNSATTRMTLDASGNLGLGVTPSAWRNGWKTLQVANTSISSDSAQTFFAYNAYLASDDFRYINSDNSTIYRQVSGQHIWATAPSGTAGNAITFTQAMTLTAAGRLLLGTATEATYMLDVNGTGRFSGNVTVETATPLFVLQASTTGTFHGIEFRQGAGLDASIKQLPASGELRISSGRSVGWGGDISFYTDTVLALSISNTGTALFASSVTASSFFESSDSRLKTLIQDNYQTKGIASITPKLYTKNGKVELGYYAQDFVGILDSAVSKGSDDMLSLSYREVLVAKVYALEQEIKELKAKMN